MGAVQEKLPHPISVQVARTALDFCVCDAFRSHGDVDFVSAELFDRHYFRVMVLHHGTIILDGTLETLQNMIGLPSLIRVKFRHPPCIRPLPEAERVEVRGEEAWISYDRRKASVPSILGAAGEWGEVEDVGMAEPDMEELIRRIYQEGETKIRDVGTVMADT